MDGTVSGTPRKHADTASTSYLAVFSILTGNIWSDLWRSAWGFVSKGRVITGNNRDFVASCMKLPNRHSTQGLLWL